MRPLLSLFSGLICLSLLAYLTLPSPPFPPPPPGSVQSHEPGDTQDPLVKAYFSDLDRDQIASHYLTHFSKSPLFSLALPTLRLPDYPPEEARERIKDQLNSSYLEEYVHPGRESVFVSVWQPTDPKDAINIDGRHFLNKITVRYFPSLAIFRLIEGLGIIAAVYLTSRFISKYIFKS